MASQPPPESSTSSTATAGVAAVAIEFTKLPDGYAPTSELSTSFVLGHGRGDDPGKPTAQQGVRRTEVAREPPLEVSVYAGRSVLFADIAGDAETSSLRGGAAVVKRLDHQTWVIWTEAEALVVLIAPADVPAAELQAIVDGLEITISSRT